MKSHHKGYTLGTRRFSLVLSRNSRRPKDDMFGQRPTHEQRKSQSSEENREKPLTPRVWRGGDTFKHNFVKKIGNVLPQELYFKKGH